MRKTLLTLLALTTLTWAQAPDPAKINEGHAGEQFQMQERLVANKINIVHFDSGFCGMCPFTATSLASLCQSNPEYVYRYVEMGEPGSPLSQQYNIKGIFGFIVYDRRGRELYRGKEAMKYLEKLYARTKTADVKGHFQPRS